MVCNPGSFEAQTFLLTTESILVEILGLLHYNIHPSGMERSETLSVKVLVVFLLVENESESGCVIQSLA